MTCQKISPNTKHFTDDTSIFYTVKNVNISTNQLNNHLEKISHWDHQWKMSFNPNPKKQAQEIILSEKTVKDCHPSVFFSVTLQWNSQ